MEQSAVQSAGAIRAVFEQVLAEPDFRRHGTSPIFGWIAGLVSAIERFLARLIPVLGETETRVISWILLTAAFAVLVTLLLRGFRDRTPVRKPDAAPVVPPVRPRSAAEWMSWARDTARAGRLREAATGVYQATILRLDARGALRYREWKTPGDYALEMADNEPTRAAFVDFLGRFLELAFGASEPTDERFEAFSAAASRIGGSA